MADPRAFAAVMSWVRFSRADALARRDGMPLANLGVRSFEVPVLRLLRACPWLARPLSACGSAAMPRRIVERQIRSSAALILVTVADARRETVVDAGRTALRAWLRLTAAGFGVQPLSLSSLNAYLASVTDLIAPSAAPFFREGRAVLQRAFGLGSSELPIWMFRTGLSPKLPDGMRTLRRAVDDVLEVATGA